MHSPLRLFHREQLKDDQPILVAIISSGDHPIDWTVYKDWRAWVEDLEIDADELEFLNEFYVYELPYSLSYYQKNQK